MPPSRLLPALAAIGALLWSVLLVATLPRSRVFYSGDGGIKSMMVRQHAQSGLYLDLRLEGPSWVKALWEEGLYPFGPPFVYQLEGKRVLHFPPLFAAATTPFYMLLGDAGYYVWPLLGACATWLALLGVCRAMRLPPTASALALATAAFASPLTLYGAMFWEHAPAVGLLAMALAFLMRGHAVAAGVAAGVAAALRPEAGLFAGLLFSVLWAAPAEQVPRWRAGIGLASFVVVVLAQFALNLIFFGSLLGLQARQEAVEHFGPVALEGRFLKLLLLYFPAALLVPLAREATARRLAVASVLFLAAGALLLPTPGGKQWGPRYLLVLVPAAAAVAGSLAAGLKLRSPAGAAIALLLVAAVTAGVWVNTVVGARRVGEDYAHRVAPLLSFLEAQPSPVAVTHQWIAQDLASLIPQHPLFRLQGLATQPYRLTNQDASAPPLQSARTLARGLLAAGVDRYWLIAFLEQRLPAEVEGDETRTAYSPAGLLGGYAVYLARVEVNRPR